MKTNVIEELVNKLIKELEERNDIAWKKQHEVTKGDMIALQNANDAIKNIAILKQDIKSIQNKFEDIDKILNADKTVTEVEIEVTSGSISQSYLRLTKAFDVGLLTWDDLDKPITIITPYETFDSEITTTKMLKSRGKIAKFYKETDLLEGEAVSLNKVGDRTFELNPISYRYVVEEK